MARALIVADAPALFEALRAALAAHGYEVLFARDASEALRSGPGAELLLWALPAGDDPAASPRGCAPGAQLVYVAPHSEMAARAALQLGADEVLHTPLEGAEVALLLRRTGERARERRARRLLGRELRRAVGERPVVAASPPMIELLETLERVAALADGVLLHGEPGTGKEGIARALHAFSPRRREPFVAVACAELRTRELTSELFGRPAVGPHELPRPGVLFDADGGTLFLDDVHALPPSLQQTLADILCTRELQRPRAEKPERIDLRVLAATSADLPRAVETGHFRRDLYERIATLTLEVPPLRDRSLDVPLLLDHLVAQTCRRSNRPPVTVASEALERLVEHPWPGNLRELEHAVAHAVALAEGDRLGLEHLPAEVANPGLAPDRSLALRGARKQLEVDLIRRALRATRGNRTHAARLLQISHRALLYKLKEHDLGD